MSSVMSIIINFICHNISFVKTLPINKKFVVEKNDIIKSTRMRIASLERLL